MQKNKKYYLEVLRIVALLCVMYNHSPAYMTFRYQAGVEYGASFLFSFLCKIAVPVFFMISGAVLLGKNESVKDIFKKRILKMILALTVFSLLYTLKLAVRGEITFSLAGFLKNLPVQEVFLPYWYLYTYLGFLFLLPFLRPLAQNMGKNVFYYLVALQVILGVIRPLLGYFFDWWLNGYFNVTPILHDIVFYPLVGYGIDRYVESDEFKNWKGILCNVAVILSVFISNALVYRDFVRNGVYTETYLGTMVSIPAMVLFLDVKMLVSTEKLSEKTKQLLSFVGGATFCMYLLDGFIGTGGSMDVIFRVLSPYVTFIPAYLIEIACVFVIRLVGAAILKKLPVFRTFL